MRPKHCERASGVGQRLVTMALVIVASTGAAMLPANGTASALNGATLTSSTVYRIDPDSTSVVVESTFVLTNTTPDQDLGIGGTRFFFFTDLTVPINRSAVGISVDVDGRSASFDIIEDDQGLMSVDVRLGRQLRFRQTATIDVRSQLTGTEPRAEDSVDRVNAAYFAFPVFAFGDAGETSVAVIVPPDWISEYIGSDLQEQSLDGSKIYEATDIEDPFEFSVLFTARNDAALGSIDVGAGDAAFDIHGWPGDQVWIEFATEQITKGVPILEELIGRDWPAQEETDVFEASTLYLRGYGGTYDPDANVIEVGENLDRHTLLHELTHAWINTRLFTERWISEGLAEEISARATEQLGDELPEPPTVAELRSDGSEVEVVDLNDWDALDTGVGDPIEPYGYLASFAVMRDLWDEVGTAQMTALLQATLDRQSAYPGEDGPDLNGEQRISWMEFLDLAEQIGGSEELIENYRAQVVTAEQRDLLAERAEALAEFDALVARGGSWAAPTDIRSLMARWHFGSARDSMVEANRALDARDELTKALAELGLVPTSRIEQTYQDDHRGMVDLLDATAESARGLIATRSELATTLGAFGFDVPALTQQRYETNPVGVETEQRSLLADASELATLMNTLDSLIADNGLTVPSLPASAFVDDSDAAIATVLDQIDAADALISARELRTQADSFVERVGASRSDVDKQLEKVTELLADGDTDGVRMALAVATNDINEFRSTGLNRIIAVASIIVGLLLLLLIVGRIKRLRANRGIGKSLPKPGGHPCVESPVGAPCVEAATHEPANDSIDPLAEPPTWPTGDSSDVSPPTGRGDHLS